MFSSSVCRLLHFEFPGGRSHAIESQEERGLGGFPVVWGRWGFQGWLSGWGDDAEARAGPGMTAPSGLKGLENPPAKPAPARSKPVVPKPYRHPRVVPKCPLRTG